MENTPTTTCPYAVALHPEEDADDEASSVLGEESSSSSSKLQPLNLRSCPAFEQGSCPFKSAKSAQEVRVTLLRMPQSHFDKNGKFFQVVQGLHQQIQSSSSSTTTATEQSLFQLAGGCPVANSNAAAAEGTGNLSFTEALEQMSLSAIMAREMEKTEAEQNALDSKEEQEAAKESTAATAATQPVVAAKPSDKDWNKATTTTTTTPSPRTSLSESLKTGTAVSHQAAEDVHFVRNFIQGKIDRHLFAELVTMLYHVYQALEECLDQHAPQYFATCHFPRELRRTGALWEDLDFWHGSSKTAAAVLPQAMSTATREYVQRLQHIGRTDPLLLLAHSYTRYLGDLSGGRILARVARKAMGLDGNDGLEFYEFEQIESPKKFKDQYRKALDALPLTSEQIGKLVGEANVAFCLNMRLFEELDVKANVPGARVRPLEEALAYADDDAVELPQDGKEECPFIAMKAAGGGGAAAAAAQQEDKRCPWPFVFAHDPVQGMRDWQTWAVVGLFLCWGWQFWCNSVPSTSSAE